MRLKGVDQVELQAIQPRFLRARSQEVWLGRIGELQLWCQGCVLEERIERATVPQGERRGGIRSNPPQTIESVLHDVGRSALIAFTPGRNRGVLLFAQEGVPNLQVVL